MGSSKAQAMDWLRGKRREIRAWERLQKEQFGADLKRKVLRKMELAKAEADRLAVGAAPAKRLRKAPKRKAPKRKAPKRKAPVRRAAKRKASKRRVKKARKR